MSRTKKAFRGRAGAAMSRPSKRNAGHIEFTAVAAAARARLPELTKRWLPDGRRHGAEWVARNPTRDDHRPGSFKVNLRTGQWADFATGDAGGDAISLAAYVFRLTQADAARKLAGMLGLGQGGRS